MKLITRNINNALYLLIQTNQFKTMHIKIRFMAPINQNTVTARNLMINMLKAKNKQFPTRKSLSKACATLYDMGYYVQASKIGMQHILQLSFNAVNPMMISEENYYENMLSMIKNIVHLPLFDAQTLKEEKQFLKDYFASEYNNKTRYAAKRYQAHLFESHPYNIHAWGIEDAIDAITLDDIENAYTDMIHNNSIIVSLVGDGLSEQHLEHLNSALNLKSKPLPKDYIYKHLFESKDAIKEVMDVTQDRLFMALDTSCFYDDKNYYTAIVFNALLGENSDSLLFKTIRESLSLAYYISSSYSPFSGLITITSGMASDHIDLAKKEILKQIDTIKNGQFDVSLLHLAKTNVITNIKSSYDSPASLASKALLYMLFDTPFDETTVINQMMSVDRNHIVAFAKKISMIFTYVLGSDVNENNAL